MSNHRNERPKLWKNATHLIMHVLLFDIDGTLIDAGGAGQAAMEQAIAREFGTTRQVENIPAAGRTDRAIGHDLFEFHGIPNTEENWRRYTTSYFSLLPESLKQCRGQLLPGVTELMHRLASRDDVFLGLLTGNFSTGARLKLEHYGLNQHFRMGGYGDIHLDRDDVARQAYTELREHLPAVEPHHVWVIGDTPSDVRCGRAIQANTVAVATGLFSREELEKHQPDVLLDNLHSAESWLNKLNS